MASPVRQTGKARSLDTLFPKISAPNCKAELPAGSGTNGLTALSVEFVAKPGEADNAPQSLPAAIAGSLQEVKGFSGCLVMISDHEARLITVVTFWSGNEAQRSCRQHVKWVKALLSTYVDSWLRVQILYAHVPGLPSAYRKANPVGPGLTVGECVARTVNACVA